MQISAQEIGRWDLWSSVICTRAGACKEVATVLKDKEDSASGLAKDKSTSAGSEMQNLRILEVNAVYKLI